MKLGIFCCVMARNKDLLFIPFSYFYYCFSLLCTYSNHHHLTSLQRLIYTNPLLKYLSVSWNSFVSTSLEQRKNRSAGSSTMCSQVVRAQKRRERKNELSKQVKQAQRDHNSHLEASWHAIKPDSRKKEKKTELNGRQAVWNGFSFLSSSFQLRFLKRSTVCQQASYPSTSSI